MNKPEKNMKKSNKAISKIMDITAKRYIVLASPDQETAIELLKWWKT